MADKNTDTAPEAEVEESAAAETSTEPKTLAAALDAAPEAEVTEEKAPEAETEVEPAAAETTQVDEDDADPDVDEVFNKRFTKDGKLDKKGLAKALKENEARAQSVDPDEYQKSLQFLDKMRKLYADRPDFKKIIDESEASGNAPVERDWADVQREADQLSKEGKASQAYALLKKFDPDLQEDRRILSTVKEDHARKNKAENDAEVATFRADVAKETGAAPTKEEEAVMYDLIVNQGMGYVRDAKGRPVNKRPMKDVWKRAVVILDQRTAEEAALARRKVTVAGKPAATSKAPAPPPAGSRSVAPSKKVSSGDADLDAFFDKADKHLGVEHKK